MSWKSPFNASVYDLFTREHGIYRWLNRRLVHHARVHEASRVLDLGCGTGATSRACLRVMHRDAELVAIDAAAPMVEVARHDARDPRIDVRVLAGERVADLPGVFDCVVSNAALWLVGDLEAVFAGLERCTTPGARVAFNLPGARVPEVESPIHPFQAAFQDELRAEGAELPAAPPLPLDRFRRLADDHGFDVVHEDTEVYRARQAELIELMRIPAMLDRAAPHLPARRAEAALGRAASRCDPTRSVAVPWCMVVLERAAA